MAAEGGGAAAADEAVPMDQETLGLAGRMQGGGGTAGEKEKGFGDLPEHLARHTWSVSSKMQTSAPFMRSV